MINLIVAMDKNRGIGRNNRLLAHIKPDLKYFKELTEGNVVVMGRKTYESLPIRPLPNRENIVLTRELVRYEGCKVAHSIKELFGFLDDMKDRNVFIIGGGDIYKQLIYYADRIYVTHIFHEFYCDTYFPEIGKEWDIVSTIATRENVEHEYPHIFTIYERKS